MNDRDTSTELWRLNTQQHVSLEKHRQMIQDALRWQEAGKLANELPKASATTLYTTLIAQLHLLMKRIRAIREPVHQPCNCDMACQCSDGR